jgi:hypothetical protein
VKEVIEEQPPQSRGSFFQRFFRRNVLVQPQTLPMYKITNIGASFGDRAIMVDEDDPTEDELIYVFTFDATEMSDGVELDEIEVQLDVDDVAANMAFDDLSLVYDGVVLGTGNVYNESVLIPNLAHVIPAGVAHSFEIRADIEEADNYPDPTEFTVNLNISDFEMEVLSTGNPVSLRRVTQSINDFDHMLTEGGIVVDLEDTDIFQSYIGNAGTPDDVGEFEIEFDVTAVGDDVYISNQVSALTYLGVPHQIGIFRDGSRLSYNAASNFSNSSSANYNPTTGNYEIEEGETETFVLTVAVNNADAVLQQAGNYQIVLEKLKWSFNDNPYGYYSKLLDPGVYATPALYLD